MFSTTKKSHMLDLLVGHHAIEKMLNTYKLAYIWFGFSRKQQKNIIYVEKQVCVTSSSK